ncbi:energy transducer TonB family protein [Rhodopseudomonas boonkerdii]|uniref:energy transducer TonB family protein n=1 Tax=Rhodopseudomonas boonkerdii TaxID=475937 RepID=UPI001E5C7803|nr:TonB family protein [Rhodopseudomonas boonkerdii]
MDPDFDLYTDSTSGTWRWFVGSAVLVPVLVVAGVYWLHQVPVGPAARQGHSTIQVELIATPSPAMEVRQASVQPNPPIVDFQTEAKISEQSVAPVEQEIAPPQPLMRPQPAAAPAQRPAGGGQRQAISAGAASRFQQQLQTHIERYQRDPGASGKVLVLFAMRRDGTLVRLDVKTSSGRALLDQEAMETIRRAQPLPRIPAEMPDLITVLLPVAFDAR